MVRYFFEDPVLLGWHGWLHLVCHTRTTYLSLFWKSYSLSDAWHWIKLAKPNHSVKGLQRCVLPFSRESDTTSGWLNIQYSTHWLRSYCCDWILDMYPTKTNSIATFALKYAIYMYMYVYILEIISELE